MGIQYTGKAVMLMVRLKRVLAGHGIYLSLADDQINYFNITRQCAELEDSRVEELLAALRIELGLDDDAAVA